MGMRTRKLRASWGINSLSTFVRLADENGGGEAEIDADDDDGSCLEAQ